MYRRIYLELCKWIQVDLPTLKGWFLINQLIQDQNNYQSSLQIFLHTMSIRPSFQMINWQYPGSSDEKQVNFDLAYKSITPQAQVRFRYPKL